MFTEQESKFITWWEANRDNQKKSFRQYVQGFSKGIGIGAAIVLIVISGWYKRANMEVNSKMSTAVFIIALLCIGLFMAWFSQNYKWEQNEQQYLELMARKRRIEGKIAEKPSEENIVN